MSNPSTVWTQLSIPLSPVGSIPYVDIDGQTITTDVANFQYLSIDYTSFAGSQLPYQLTVSNGLRVSYTDATSIPSLTYTINKPSGRVTLPQGQNTITVTSACCFASSMIFLNLIGPYDANITAIIAVPSAGSFTVTGNSMAAAADIVVDFLIVNRR